jgi:hypothetical protein
LGLALREKFNKLILREYMDGGDLFGFLQFAAGILSHHQVVQLAADSAQYLPAISFYRLFGVRPFQPVQCTGE